jgi:hypothetical protein
VQDRRASSEYPEAKRLLGALANSRGHRHEENAARLTKTALEQPIQVGAALLASAEGYTPRSTKLIDDAREQLGAVADVALALSDNLPAPKQQPSKRRRRRRKKKMPGADGAAATQQATDQPKDGEASEKPKPRRRRRKPKPAGERTAATATEAPATAAPEPQPDPS